MNDIGSIESQKLLRVGIYLRLSDEDTDKQNKRDDSESIKNQRNLLLDEIAKRSNFILVDEYCDENLSGAGTYRPNFERLINDCENGKLDIVLCKSQSRFSRDVEVVEKYLHNKFLEWKVRFIGVSDNADTDNLGNKKARQINGLVNEWYLEDGSGNIRSALKSKMKQGEFISPFAPYGYLVCESNNNKLVIDEIASNTVKDIFALYLLGFGFTAIAKHLNNKNVPSPSLYKYQNGSKLNIVSNRAREEIKWTTNAIKTILKNEVYVGHLIQGKRTTVSYKNRKIKIRPKKEWIRKENTHQGIISQNIFDKVQIEMKQRTRPIKKTGQVHNFSGKVFCEECGRYFKKKNSTKYEYLVCSNNRDGYDNCPNKSSIRYDALEKVLLNALNKKIGEYFDEERLKQENDNNIKSSFENKIKILKKQKRQVETNLWKIKKTLKELYNDKIDGIITLEQFKELLNDYNKSEKIQKEQLKEIDKEVEFYIKKENTLLSERLMFKKFESLNRVIVEEFVDSLYIGNINEENRTREIKIKWNFK